MITLEQLSSEPARLYKTISSQRLEFKSYALIGRNPKWIILHSNLDRAGLEVWDATVEHRTQNSASRKRLN